MKALKFYAEWCQPCKALSKIFEGAADRITMPVEEVDIDSNLDLALKYGIRGVPAVVVVNEDGSEVRRISGVVSEAALLEFLGE